MPSFSVVNKIVPSNSFRSKSIIGKFDLGEKNFQEKIEGDLSLPSNWRVGIVVGPSGSGKTTICRTLYPDRLFNKFNYSEPCIIDDMPSEKSADEVAMAFNSVGFSTPISWLKPYSVLSNGEKMRVDLARCLLEENDLIVFDEFTSVVDRQVAKIGSSAISKAVKKTNKQFIAVSCHYDIIDWLEPDWVFNTATMSMNHTRGLLRRPKIKLEIYEKKGLWELFRKHHYLNHSLSPASKQYVGFVNGEPCCFIATLPVIGYRKRRKIHRLVTLPDYQGVGIAKAMLEKLSSIYSKKGLGMNIVTSHPALANYLFKSNKWTVFRKGRVSPADNLKLKKTSSASRLTVSAKFKK